MALLVSWIDFLLPPRARTRVFFQQELAGAEARVKAAVGQVSGQGEVIIVGRVLGVADSDNLAVRLEENGVDIIIETVKIGDDPAAIAKGFIERSVGL